MICHYCEREHVGWYKTDDESEHPVCDLCAAWLEVIAMKEGKPVALYGHDTNVVNFTETLQLQILTRKDGKHNLAGKKTTIHFRGPDNSTWTGTLYHGPCCGDLLRNVRPLRQNQSF